MKKRWLYYIPALLFVVFAGVQYNDPDPFLWIGIYLYVAVANIMAALGRLPYSMVIAGFLGMLFLITSNFPAADLWGFDHEEGREIMGLILSCNWMALLGIFKLYKEAYH